MLIQSAMLLCEFTYTMTVAIPGNA